MNSLRQQSDEAHKLHGHLARLIKGNKIGFVMMGEVLYQLNKKNLFKKAVGEGIETWDDYLAQPEISLSRGEASRLMQIYEYFVQKLGYSSEEISEISVKNMHYLLPIAKQQDSIEQIQELVGAAKTLSQKDFKERIFEFKSDDQEKTYEYAVFRKCIETGSLSKVHGITDQLIRESFNLSENAPRTQTQATG